MKTMMMKTTKRIGKAPGSALKRSPQVKPRSGGPKLGIANASPMMISP